MVVGVDIGGTKTAVIAAENNEIIHRVAFETADFISTYKKITAAVNEYNGVKAIGISCGGPLDSKRGVILSPPNLPGWDNIQISDMLGNDFGVPVRLQNDANACAMAELKFGAGIGCENIVFLTFGTGLGAGIIINGKIYCGASDMAGEVGHIRLSDYGPVGYGKSGSFEGFCSGGGLAELGKLLAREALQMGKSVSYCKNYGELDKITAKSIAVLAQNGNDDAAEVYRICGRMLGRGLSIIIDILNPEKIIIGSVFQRSEILLRNEMNNVIECEALKNSRDACAVVPAALGDKIGDYAAIAVAYDALTEA